MLDPTRRYFKSFESLVRVLQQMNLDELEPEEVEAVLPLLPSPLEEVELNSRLRVNMDEGTTI